MEEVKQKWRMEHPQVSQVSEAPVHILLENPESDVESSGSSLSDEDNGFQVDPHRDRVAVEV
jgi:hypothetical protein